MFFQPFFPLRNRAFTDSGNPPRKLCVLDRHCVLLGLMCAGVKPSTLWYLEELRRSSANRRNSDVRAILCGEARGSPPGRRARRVDRSEVTVAPAGFDSGGLRLPPGGRMTSAAEKRIGYKQNPEQVWPLQRSAALPVLPGQSRILNFPAGSNRNTSRMILYTGKCPGGPLSVFRRPGRTISCQSLLSVRRGNTSVRPLGYGFKPLCPRLTAELGGS
jgi:hypothetical protein